jgi:phytanoyl-CoA hydroxylase
VAGVYGAIIYGMSVSHKQQFDRDGYVIARNVFAADETERLRDHFMTLRRRGSYPNDLVGVNPGDRDPLRRYPRMAQMHRWDDVSLRWLLDERLRTWLVDLLGAEPLAAQTMLYFKPPGSRGQAVHQDNYYLRVQPGTCIAAWLALDRADDDNGCLTVVPGSHRWPILCTRKADTKVSFTDVTVPVPDDRPVVSAVMEPGDVLFFHGSLVHGSRPNRTEDRFRRSLIGHYIDGDAQQVAAYYHPTLRMDGTPVELVTSPDGGACGEWVEQDGELVPALIGTQTITRKHE